VNRLLYVCLDGLGDDPVAELDDLTPLEAAKTPVLDALAQRGRTGTVLTVGEGIAPESDIAVFAILGYDPHEEHPRRGVVEAIGVGMDFRDGEALEGFDALYVHIKGPDVPAHDGRAEDKRDVIELIDRAFFSEVMPLIDPGRTVVAVTADHSTSCVRKAHTAEPVPLLVSGPGVASDGSVAFGERACAAGSLGLLRGVDILPRLMALLGK
jgi:2,3-bisphosphoglycerate-independent phosphoglycerate mutase